MRLRTYFSVSYYAFLFSIMLASLFILFIILNALRFVCPLRTALLCRTLPLYFSSIDLHRSHAFLLCAGTHAALLSFHQSICIVHTHFCFPTILPIIILLDIMCCSELHSSSLVSFRGIDSPDAPRVTFTWRARRAKTFCWHYHNIHSLLCGKPL